jgi:hypothetical protein
MYKITVLHKLAQLAKEQSLHVATWGTHEGGVLRNTWFINEANFQLAGTVKTQIIRFWVAEYPRQIQERNIYGEEVLFGLAQQARACWDHFSSSRRLFCHAAQQFNAATFCYWSASTYKAAYAGRSQDVHC